MVSTSGVEIVARFPASGMLMDVDRVGIAVVGAGHAGLCVVGALQRRSLAVVVFDDAERIGDVWRSRYEDLILNTERDLSAIPGVAVPARVGRWPARDEWADHIESAARQLVVDRCQDRVLRIERTGRGWILAGDEGVVEAGVVVVATGRARVPLVPDWPGRNESDVQVVHSSEFVRGSDFADRRVVVVGSGNSGAEIAHLLAAAGANVTWSIRTRPVWARREVLGATLTRLAMMGKRLPDRVIDVGGRMSQPLLFGRMRRYGLGPPQRRLSQVAEASGATLDSGVVADVKAGRVALVGDIEGFTTTGVRLTDDTEVACDVLIAATGFSPGLEGLLPANVLTDDGWPHRGEPPFEQAPGLYTAGLNPATLTAFHPDFITEAEHIAAAIAARA